MLWRRECETSSEIEEKRIKKKRKQYENTTILMSDLKWTQAREQHNIMNAMRKDAAIQ